MRVNPVLLALLLTLPVAAGFGATRPCLEEASAALECREHLWSAADGALTLSDEGAIAYSPDGSALVLLGTSAGRAREGQVVAMDAATGETRWRFLREGSAWPVGLAVDDARAYAAFEDGLHAVDLATGAEAWRVAGGQHRAAALAGGLLVLGGSAGLRAYDAVTGALVWERDGLAVSALVVDGATLHAGGGRWGEAVLLALDAATGELLDERPARVEMVAHLLAQDGRVVAIGRAALATHEGARSVVTPLPLSEARSAALFGGRAFVTGWGPEGYVTIAVDLATGAPAWVRTYGGRTGFCNYPTELAVTPDGERVIVTGYSFGLHVSEDIVTIAYDAQLGLTEWTAREGDFGSDLFPHLVIAPGGGAVAVSGDMARGSTEDATSHLGVRAYRI